MALDMWGREAPVPGSGIDAGDPDAVCPADPATLVSVPWLPGTAQVVLDMPPPPGGGATEPRQLLKQAIARLAALGLKAVVATELEFYLLAGDSPPRAADLPLSRRPQRANQHQSVDMLEEFSGLLAEIHRACAIQGLPTDTTVTEFGTGQFEINLRHQADALAAADQAVAFRRLVRGVARRHGLVASFMAKPFGDQAGSGLHVHASLLDATGRNVFDDGTAAGSPLLKAAIGGLLDAMPATTLLFAPHLNSYRRLRPGSYAPTAASWGYDNRTAAVRVPFGAGADRRFEHRVAGADANDPGSCAPRHRAITRCRGTGHRQWLPAGAARAAHAVGPGHRYVRALGVHRGLLRRGFPQAVRRLQTARGSHVREPRDGFRIRNLPALPVAGELRESPSQRSTTTGNAVRTP
jgi:glutamine synthetase